MLAKDIPHTSAATYVKIKFKFNTYISILIGFGY